ncbi:MAG: hypothetical protein II920_08655, partial [Clostridia bacterium]|nr:hypothetical protein [Clostridia bacterium]
AYKNVHAEGEFPMSETLMKYEGVDAVLNMYGNHNPKLDYALSNKLYISAALALPIIVCPHTCMSETAEKYSTGFTLDIDRPEDRDRLYEYLTGIDRAEFIYNCDRLLENTRADDERFNKLIARFTCREA